MNGLCLRAVRADDLPAVKALALATPGAPCWTQNAYRSYIENSTTSAVGKLLLLAERRGVLQGFAAATVLAPEAELESIVVAAASRRRGVATRLLTAVQSWAVQQGADALRLEVRSCNATALGFYRAHGFQRAGLRPGYYADPIDDAVQLSRDLTELLANALPPE